MFSFKNYMENNQQTLRVFVKQILRGKSFYTDLPVLADFVEENYNLTKSANYLRRSVYEYILTLHSSQVDQDHNNPEVQEPWSKEGELDWEGAVQIIGYNDFASDSLYHYAPINLATHSVFELSDKPIVGPLLTSGYHEPMPSLRRIDFYYITGENGEPLPIFFNWLLMSFVGKSNG